MHNLMKLTILFFVVIALTACFNSTRTKYRDRAVPTTAEPERDAPAPEFGSDPEFGDNIFGATTTSIGLATVTRVQRNTGQTITAGTDFNPHQSSTSIYGQIQYTIGAAGTRNPSALAIRTDAQLYPGDGSDPMLFAASGSSTLEFPSRGDVFRGVAIEANGPGTRLTIQGTTNPTDPWQWRDWEHPVLTSFQFTRNGDNPGIVMNFGADGNGGAIFSDLESYTAKECATAAARNCNAPNTHDISIAFGANRLSNPAAGALAYYWQALVPNHHKDKDGAVLVPGETSTSLRGPGTLGPDIEYTVTEDVGTYTLELTHTTTSVDNSADADAQRYLSYAAYGLFNFFDKYNRRVVGTDGGLSRMQTISYGFDAFADAGTMRTTDLATNIEATFKGRTMAYLMHLEDDTFNNREVTALTRLRGDISLTANIGPNGANANTITGTISGMEHYSIGVGRPASWSNSDITAGGNTNEFSFSDAFSGRNAVLDLTGGTIAADGSYTGTVTPGIGPDDFFADGVFKGNLYGPRDRLETAGTWYMPTTARPTGTGIAGIIGSFGACQDGLGRC